MSNKESIIEEKSKNNIISKGNVFINSFYTPFSLFLLVLTRYLGKYISVYDIYRLYTPTHVPGFVWFLLIIPLVPISYYSLYLFLRKNFNPWKLGLSCAGIFVLYSIIELFLILRQINAGTWLFLYAIGIVFYYSSLGAVLEYRSAGEPRLRLLRENKSREIKKAKLNSLIAEHRAYRALLLGITATVVVATVGITAKIYGPNITGKDIYLIGTFIWLLTVGLLVGVMCTGFRISKIIDLLTEKYDEIEL
jgi:hypothetical protein